MTLSDAHEDIVDDLAGAANLFNCQYDVLEDWLSNGVGIIIEHIVAAVISPGLKHLRLHADCYIFPPNYDGHCVIPVEVGHMRDGKWDSVNDATDGMKIRILRIDFRKNIHFIRPRHTEFERKFIDFLNTQGFTG